MKGLNLLEDSVEYILYLNGKPAARYETEEEAFNDIQHLTQAGHKPKLMKQVCNTVPLDEDSAKEIEKYKFHSLGKLDTVLLELCKMVIEGKKANPDLFGMVAACVIDIDDNKVFGINLPDKAGKRMHAERVAINAYKKEYGDIAEGAIIVTTLSPCSDDMEERHGESCSQLIQENGVHKVYCGYIDPSQHHTHVFDFAVKETEDKSIRNLCKKFADTFLDSINESKDSGTSKEDLLSMLKEFLPIAVEVLQLKSLPKIKPVLRLDHGQHPSFGMYVNETNTIELAISDRHPVDILRTLAHELVHCKQREDNRLKPDSGETGSDEENEANAVAGVIMRNFDDANPEVFDEKPIKLGENIASLGRRTANYIRNIGQPENPSATLYTNPEYRGSKISNQAINDRPIVNVPIKSLTPWEPDDKMTYTGNRMNVLSMVSAIEQGKQLPPIITVKKGNTYLILDGHHRYEAYRQAGVKTVPVKVLDPKEIRYSDEVLHELDDKVKPKSWDDYGQPAAPSKKKPEPKEKVFIGWQHYDDSMKSKDEKKKEVKEGTDYAKGNIDYHDTLNPLAWQNNSLRKEVRARLLEIAKVFVDYLDIPQFEVSDIVLTGSMANYNYTEQSDFDLHIITDYADLQCEDLAEALYQAKKHIWNDAHDITIYGHDVEMYIEDISKPPVSSGVYSVLSNQWLKKPKNNPQDIDQAAVNSKVRSLIDQIYRALADANDPTDIKRLIEKLRKMRRSALEIGGEFSIENLAYKIIRNEGYLQHIYDTLVLITDQQLSLNENFTPIEIAIMEGGHSLDE